MVPGRVLTPKQIRGIKNLVASSVSKLKAENVALINDEGETLGGDDEFSQLSELSDKQQKFKARAERKLEEKIVKVLAPFIGGNERVVAKVTVDTASIWKQYIDRIRQTSDASYYRERHPSVQEARAAFEKLMGQPTEHYPLAVMLRLAGRDEEGQRDDISCLLILLGPRNQIEEPGSE